MTAEQHEYDEVYRLYDKFRLEVLKLRYCKKELESIRMFLYLNAEPNKIKMTLEESKSEEIHLLIQRFINKLNTET